MIKRSVIFSVFLGLAGVPLNAAVVKDAASLIRAVESSAAGDVIEIESGVYRLEKTLVVPHALTLKGAGAGKTILTGLAGWKPSTQSLPDPEMKLKGLEQSAYLIRIKSGVHQVTVTGMTLRGPQLHGAIFANRSDDLVFSHLRIEDFMWSGIRTFGMRRAKIHDTTFVDAGGRWQKGKPGHKGGITGGGIFAVWMKDSEIFNNRFLRTQMGKADEYYGIKVRQAKRCRVHHNTIEVNFSMEFPFENDEDVQIDHNIMHGTLSLPKHAGGPVPASGKTFHIHHNYFKNTYAIEFVRNGIEISHNLFDFDPQKDHGNLISGFGRAPAKGPAHFHNNLVSNPGRGVIWINEVYQNLLVEHNHIIARPTKTPREDGLFGLNKQTDFITITIQHNVIECRGIARPLVRNVQSRDAVIQNNKLINISDVDSYANPEGKKRPGLVKPLRFRCGVNGELSVDGWQVEPSLSPAKKD